MKLPSHVLADGRIPTTLDLISLGMHELEERGVPIELFCDEDDEWPYVISHRNELRALLRVEPATDKFLVRWTPMEFSVSDSRTFKTIEELALFLDGLFFYLNRMERTIT